MADSLFKELESDSEAPAEQQEEQSIEIISVGGVDVQQVPEESELESTAPVSSVIGAIEAAASDHEGRLKRLQADFENLKERSERERKRYRHRATATLVSRLLPILDNFERALAVGGELGDVESMRDGVVLIFRQLLDELRKEGLEAIDSIGQVFDPEFHEAVETESGTDQAPNHVIEEFQRGYRMRGELLRPALVKVSIDAMDELESQEWDEDY